jgi:hypothetical protein
MKPTKGNAGREAKTKTRRRRKRRGKKGKQGRKIGKVRPDLFSRRKVLQALVLKEGGKGVEG